MTDVDALVRAVKEARPRQASEAADALQAEALPALLDLVRDEDPEVREVALGALGRVRDPRVAPAFVRALGDAARFNRNAALRGLARAGDLPPDLPLLEAFDGADAAMAAELARILGRCASVTDEQLRDRRGRASDALVRVELTAALARRGDEEAVQEIARGLDASTESDRLAWLGRASYVGAKALLPSLRDLLDDTSRLQFVTGHPAGPEELRACDTALLCGVRIAGQTFPFVDGPANFSAEERAQVRETWPKRGA